jgi:PKD repeat protein
MMAFSGNFMCTSFKKELMTATHNFTNSTGNTFKLALYTNSASFTAATTAYTTSNEVSGTGYSAGGSALTNVTPTTSSTTALTDFADLTFSSATITARGALIYNDSATGDPSVVVLDFGGDKTSTAGDFTVVFPTADASSAIIRIA